MSTKLLGLALVFAGIVSFFTACQPHARTPCKYQVGQKVVIIVNSKLAIVNRADDFTKKYDVRYSNDFGEIAYATLHEYELAPAPKNNPLVNRPQHKYQEN